MKDEIKEILDKLNEDKDYDDYVDYKGSYFKPLLDYITNLQDRIDKAIEYHNNCIENLELSKINDNEKLAYQVAYEIHKNYLNILKGEDE